ncbi:MULTISPECIES: pyridoxamine 5'-phosphate oxidase family protein [unclassified Rhizobium]|uniref:pyridoxamine 5'-phosphate oxidase family protein n=1 Tax=unclassified Rhizobium TaxID=2613769 RepID=UPI00160278AC|nr:MULTISPECIES: pyridoxamine 5'-phosphate oxidase family protein [unclassified Rhizobium]MBB1250900.1 pyridoxamine 5'-phosphate oxidase family protein [Rhizobium sp. G21]MCV3764333.1 pyridoxamine 5'-phosphate oxidase family protein [Rhizobium sp. TRM95796]
MKTVQSVEELNTLYGQPGEASIIKVIDRLTPEYRRMIEASPFVALATVGPEGLDCSPRGDAGQVVFVEDERTVLMPDWRGNNRVDSLSNIVRDPRVGLMFLIPGSNTTMRLNGKASLVIDEAMTTRFTMDGKHPRSVIVITIEEVYTQCARAVIRADLWNAEKHLDPKSLPTVGQMMQTIKQGFDGDAYDRDWPGRAANTMW